MNDNKAKRYTPAEMIRKFAEGDNDAAREFERINTPVTRKYFLSKGKSPEDADDLVQEFYMKVFKYGKSFDYESDPQTTAWLARVAYSTLINSLRTSRKHFNDRSLEESILSEEKVHPEFLDLCMDGAVADFMMNKIRKALEKAVNRLEQSQYKKRALAFRLQYFEGHTYESIAEILNIPVGTVKSHIYRAKQDLEKDCELVKTFEEYLTYCEAIKPASEVLL